MYLIEILGWKTLPAQGFEPANDQPSSSSLQPLLQYRANQIVLKWKFLINCFGLTAKTFLSVSLSLLAPASWSLFCWMSFFRSRKKVKIRVSSQRIGKTRLPTRRDDSEQVTSFELWARPGSSSGRAQAMPELILNLDKALWNL